MHHQPLSPKEYDAVELAHAVLALSYLRESIDAVGVEAMMCRMDEETFWKLWSWFKKVQT